MTNEQKIPTRAEAKEEFTWDLSLLYTNDKDWEIDLKKLENYIPEIEQFKGTLGQSATRLAECLQFSNKVELLDEKVGHYAYLRKDEDAGDSKNQERLAKYVSIATRLGAAASFMNPEIQAIPQETIQTFLQDEHLQEFLIVLNKLLRFKPHILSENEEKLLAMQAEANQTAQKTFGALTNVDFDFGTIDGIALSQSSFASFMINSDRELREKAYKQFYGVYDQHKNTLASLYGGSVHLDIYQAKARNYKSSREMALFPDKVPGEVYDNLVGEVHNALPFLHEYYKFRKEILNVDELRHYDVYVPVISDIQVKHTYDQAVDVIIKALQPLGDEYTSTLKTGLLGRWVDRYENKGKTSGAYSSGGFIGNPYILMNYKEDVLRDVYTLAHEGGHSMHSWYSVRNNPFQHYNYTIFEAEVASTFNEQLLFKYMMDNSDNIKLKAYLLNKQVDDILATIFRQTMFAEFEDKCHSMAEQGQALTVDSLRSTYRDLLEQYFGPAMNFEDVSDLEGLRIPHFYRAFYVYKYATGLSAAVALSRKVLNGGDKEREDYLSFLKSGGSKYPLESLAAAGVDMTKPLPVKDALNVFNELLTRMREIMV